MDPDSTADATDCFGFPFSSDKHPVAIINDENDFLCSLFPEFQENVRMERSLHENTDENHSGSMNHFLTLPEKNSLQNKNIPNGHTPMVEELKMEKLREECKESKETNIMLQSQVADYEDKLSHRMRDILNLKMEVDSLRKFKEMHDENKSIHEKEKSELLARIEQLQAEVYQYKELKMKKVEDDNVITELQKDLSSKKKAHEKMTSELQSIQSFLSDKNIKMKELKRNNKKLWAVVSRFGKKLARLDMLSGKEKEMITKEYNEELFSQDWLDAEDQVEEREQPQNSAASDQIPPEGVENPSLDDSQRDGRHSDHVRHQSASSSATRGSNYFLKGVQKLLDDSRASDDLTDVTDHEVCGLRQLSEHHKSFAPISPMPLTPPPKHLIPKNSPQNSIAAVSGPVPARSVTPAPAAESPIPGSARRLTFCHQQSEGFEVSQDASNRSHARKTAPAAENLADSYKLSAKRRRDGTMKLSFNVVESIDLEVNANDWRVSCVFGESAPRAVSESPMPQPALPVEPPAEEYLPGVADSRPFGVVQPSVPEPMQPAVLPLVPTADLNSHRPADLQKNLTTSKVSRHRKSVFKRAPNLFVTAPEEQQTGEVPHHRDSRQENTESEGHMSSTENQLESSRSFVSSSCESPSPRKRHKPATLEGNRQHSREPEHSMTPSKESSLSPKVTSTPRSAEVKSEFVVKKSPSKMISEVTDSVPKVPTVAESESSSGESSSKSVKRSNLVSSKKRRTVAKKVSIDIPVRTRGRTALVRTLAREKTIEMDSENAKSLSSVVPNGRIEKEIEQKHGHLESDQSGLESPKMGSENAKSQSSVVSNGIEQKNGDLESDQIDFSGFDMIPFNADTFAPVEAASPLKQFLGNLDGFVKKEQKSDLNSINAVESGLGLFDNFFTPPIKHEHNNETNVLSELLTSEILYSGRDTVSDTKADSDRTQGEFSVQKNSAVMDITSVVGHELKGQDSPASPNINMSISKQSVSCSSEAKDVTSSIVGHKLEDASLYQGSPASPISERLDDPFPTVCQLPDFKESCVDIPLESPAIPDAGFMMEIEDQPHDSSKQGWLRRSNRQLFSEEDKTTIGNEKSPCKAQKNINTSIAKQSVLYSSESKDITSIIAGHELKGASLCQGSPTSPNINKNIAKQSVRCSSMAKDITSIIAGHELKGTSLCQGSPASPIPERLGGQFPTDCPRQDFKESCVEIPLETPAVPDAGLVVEIEDHARDSSKQNWLSRPNRQRTSEEAKAAIGSEKTQGKTLRNINMSIAKQSVLCSNESKSVQDALSDSDSDNRLQIVDDSEVAVKAAGSGDEPSDDPADQSPTGKRNKKGATKRKRKSKPKFTKKYKKVVQVVENVHPVQSVFQDIEKIKFNDAHFKLHIRTLVNALINPTNVPHTESLIYHLVNHLRSTRKNPMVPFCASRDATVLLPMTENCIVTALFQISRRMKSHLDRLLESCVHALHHLVIGKEQYTIYGLSALCRVLTEICKRQGDRREPVLLCCELLKLQHKFAPYLVASVVGVWSELFEVLEDTSDEKKIFLSALASGLQRKPKTLTDTQWKNCNFVLSQFLIVRTDFDAVEAAEFLLGEIRMKCMAEPYSDDFMLTTPLIIYSRLNGWDWSETHLLAYILMCMKKFSEEETNEAAFKFFCELYAEIILLFPTHEEYREVLFDYFRMNSEETDFVSTTAAITILRLYLLQKELFPEDISDWMNQNYENPKVKPIEIELRKRLMLERDLEVDDILLL